MLSIKNQDTTPSLPMLHRMGKDDVEQHRFIYENIWSMKGMIDEASNIGKLDPTFKDRPLI
jgi:hypothetical protein